MSDSSTPAEIEDLGDAPPALIEEEQWLKEEAKRNLDRLESAAQTIIQLVTGLYGLLFVILAVNEDPLYLRDPVIKGLATIALFLFFIALAASFFTLNPRSYIFQEGNVRQMQSVRPRMLERKRSWIYVAGFSFLVGMAFLGGLIFRILWF
jgi:hypothetical protein